ncbi:DNA polymerase Y family protein, partial [Luteimonas sp. SJ-92]
MRWACILLPQLALDGALRRRADAAAPLVLVAGGAQRRVLHAANPAARALGLRPGMALTAAQALATGFAVLDHDPREVLRWQRFLAAWAYRFSSQVSLRHPHALIVEIGASHGLFGPWPRFEERLREELAALGFRHRIVAAPNPAAARALANVHDGLAVPDGEALHRALGQLPVARAGFAPEVATALARMGLRRLAQVRALPRASLARRFPAAVLGHLDALWGDVAQPLEWYRPPDRFDARIELGFEVESHQALLFPLRRLTADLAAYLAGRDGGVQRFELHLEHEDAADSVVVVGLLGTEREPALLFDVARTRLERAGVPAPVRGLRLLARELPAFAPAHRELFEDRPQQSMPWEQLRERLRARLGDDAVHGLRVHPDHRPEHAWRGESAAKPGAG